MTLTQNRCSVINRTPVLVFLYKKEHTMELNLSYPHDVDIDSGNKTFTNLDEHKSAERQVQPRESLTPSLRSLLDLYGSFPPYSLVIGLCNDGLPFMLSLDNPKPGSILVVGNDSTKTIQLLKVITLSACILNIPQNVSICVISNNRNEFARLQGFPHCEGILSPYDRNAGEMIIEFASIAEQRRSGRERGGRILLVIDDLSSCDNLISDYSVYLNLKSLIMRGPKSGIWPIISIPSHSVDDANPQLLRSFGAYIFGKPSQKLTISSNSGKAMIPENTYLSDFDVIIDGRLIPITDLSI
jgi:hypothetical protein